MLSILIPSFNDRCLSLVKALVKQLSLAENLKYEILVADDGSTCMDVIEENRNINSIADCRFIERGVNVGRSAIRNFLAYEAQYPTLLFLDCEVIIPEHFIGNYLCHASEADVICGGICTDGDEDELRNNLRFRYEKDSERSFTAEERNRKGYHSFRTTNFLIKRETFLKVLFDETITTYGYEDVIFGKELMIRSIPLLHIDNAVAMCNYEDNKHFIEKTEEALRTMKSLEKELQGFSSILTCTGILNKFHLLGIAEYAFSKVNKKLRTNLCSSSPKLFYYKIYKLGYYLSL